MRIELHIGVEHCGAARLQAVLAARRDALTSQGVRFAASPGNRNHTRLWMAVTDPDHVDPLRYNRGFTSPERQAALRDTLRAELAREVETHRPEILILSASQLCWLASRSELERLRDLLAPLSDDIRVTAHVDEQARLLTRVYAGQILDGRGSPLDRELAMAGRGDWWNCALAAAPEIDPRAGVFAETQAVPFWLDFAGLVRHWDSVFGPGSMHLRSYDPKIFDRPEVTEEIRDAFGLSADLGEAPPVRPATPPSAAWLARGRHLNDLLLRLLAGGDYILPRKIWRGFVDEIRIDGTTLDPTGLGAVSDAFARDNARLVPAHAGLRPNALNPSRAGPEAWREADPGNGFRASQYLLSFLWRIRKATRDAAAERDADPARLNGRPAAPSGLTADARAILPTLAVENFEKLRRSPFAPHNRMGAVNEEQFATAYAPAPPRALTEGDGGNVIVGCMKNEAPYIVEWLAYHRAIGVDGFLIYSNGCEDGTSEILDRLAEIGVIQHRRNDDWKGKSPQQHALNRSLEEPLIRDAAWIIHVDVDEFINIRCGNGTLDDLLARVPDATNIAMTWRLFGHNGVTDLRDGFVIEQFDGCAPKFCPKPHTVWGFKTMFRNIGAYEKISCHRPNKLVRGMEDRVTWVNGSGQDITAEFAKKGWRNSRKSIGYDLVQLNHYALRSAESFLIKRQRGRALHVDRSIGLNYWVRMDWCDHRDLTIQRNVPRVRAEFDRLMLDDRLRRLHANGRAWHRAKADELRGIPEFRDLFEQAQTIRLTSAERAAFALALDHDS